MNSPIEPDESDCCNSGCQPCIFDVYQDQLRKYLLGATKTSDNLNINCLKLLKYTKFTLKNIIEHTKHSNIYIFECVDCSTEEEAEIFFSPGDHCLLKGCTQVEFSRAYTPIPYESLSKKQFAVLIKLYRDGKMSRCIENWKIGMETLWRGPYSAPYKYESTHRGLLMFAQGTGVAPLYAIARDILDNHVDSETRLKLIYCCRSLDEVHLHRELYSLLDYWNFLYELFLSDGYKEGDKLYRETVHCGRLSENIIKKCVSDGKYDRILVCGSKHFEESFRKLFESYEKHNIYYF